MIYTYDSNGNMIGEYQKGKSRYHKMETREYKAIKYRKAKSVAATLFAFFFKYYDIFRAQ